MPDISQTTVNKYIYGFLLIKFVPKDQINNIPTLVQIMAWCPQSDNLLSKPMMETEFTDAYMRHLASVS